MPRVVQLKCFHNQCHKIRISTLIAIKIFITNQLTNRFVPGMFTQMVNQPAHLTFTNTYPPKNQQPGCSYQYQSNGN